MVGKISDDGSADHFPDASQGHDHAGHCWLYPGNRGQEKQQEREVAVARKNVETALKKMMDARTETKIFEKLKEDDFKEFMIEEGKAESKEIDELNSFRFSEKARRGE